jgi:hypothetical protein
MSARTGLILTLGLAVLLVACAGPGSRDTASRPPTPAQVEAKLLTLDDLGAGWRAGQAINSADLSSVTESIPCSDVTIDPVVAKRLKAVTGIQFEPADRSYKHLIQLAMTGASAQLANDLRKLFAAMDSCAVKASASPGTAKLTLNRFTVPQLGDQRAAYVMITRESAGSRWYVRNAIVRVGPVAIAFGLAEILATPDAGPQISDDWFQRHLRTAVARFGT